MNPFGLLRHSVVIYLVIVAAPEATAETKHDIDEIVVTADLRGRTIEELPASISVLDADQVEALSVQHFEELVSVVPNLNWSGDGHRARYFQIRGVGELEQYQGAPNPSVGFLIDDIDFSGIGTIASLFDIERVEVLRGPQGSRYGANALAGLIYMRSTSPNTERNGRLQLSAADDDAFSAGLAFGGSLDAGNRALFRLSAQHHQSNGYRNNAYLDREDSNGRDETVVRGRLLLQPSESVDVNVAALYANVDNGYDAFSLDNSYTMLSDKPGKDAQESVGVSVRADYFGLEQMTLTSITAFADSDIEFSFDADWGNDDSWGPFTYDYISASDRARKTLSQEFRLASDSSASLEWLAGFYAHRLEDDLVTINRGDYFDPFISFADSLDDAFGSSYDATSVAAFGQIERQVSAQTRLSIGLRVERRSADYDDSAGLTEGPSETMTGGEISLSHDHSDALTSFISLSKGYKAGGFNLSVVPDGRREFGEESLWNIEVGLKTAMLKDSLRVNAAAFLSRRDDQQVRTSFQLIPGDPASFVFFTDNAAQGETLGFEVDANWQISDEWQIYANLGLLNASFDKFVTPQVNLGGRGQAHAPRYTFAAGGAYRHPSGWFVRVDVSGKDEFYFDVSHDQKSSAYELVNARIGFEADSWSATLWARNLFDTDYAVRGFFFGNEPPNFANTLYTRLGDPRQVGLTFDKRF